MGNASFGDKALRVFGYIAFGIHCLGYGLAYLFNWPHTRGLKRPSLAEHL